MVIRMARRSAIRREPAHGRKAQTNPQPTAFSPVLLAEAYEEILIQVLELEAEWRLDDRIRRSSFRD